jgi:ribosomal protein S18 acetylase RimI-like enzyme
VELQFGPWDDEAQDSFFAAAWIVTAYEIVVCDGVPCGYLAVEERPDDVHVRELVLSPEFQSRGIGSTVLRQIMDHARSRGVTVHLGTQLMNRAANLYLRLGFREIGRTDTHILFEWQA